MAVIICGGLSMSALPHDVSDNVEFNDDRLH